jgi:coiled-coil domain-containing protein 130
MSSLAASQADGYYLPPEYYESGAYKRQSKNDWWKKQRGERSQQKGEKRSGGKEKGSSSSGEAVVRFELPSSGTCEGCRAWISRGTRYNAVKIKTDATHFTTPIWEFRITCRTCGQQEFVIRTDPAARGFAYVSGIQRQQRHDDTEKQEEEEVSETPTGLEQVEKLKAGERRAQTELEQLQALQCLSDQTYRDDADRNAELRKVARVGRKKRKRLLQESRALGWHERDGVNPVLLETDVTDRAEAAIATYGDARGSEKRRLNSLRRSSIFSKDKSSERRKRKRSRQPKIKQETECFPQEVISDSRSCGRHQDTPTAEVSAEVQSRSDVRPVGDVPVKPRRKLLVTTNRQTSTTESTARSALADSAMAALAEYDSSSEGS